MGAAVENSVQIWRWVNGQSYDFSITYELCPTAAAIPKVNKFIHLQTAGRSRKRVHHKRAHPLARSKDLHI
jgi:hypothetical protein